MPNTPPFSYNFVVRTEGPGPGSNSRMRRALYLGIVLSVTAAAAPPAAAQTESHCVPAELPAQLFPTWVQILPSVDSQEISAPLLADAARSRKAAAKPAGGQNRPDATNLAEMCNEPREAIRLAEAGKFREAATAGDALLEGPREQYRDFTWDYLANATAWSFLQCGNLMGAARAHLNAAARVDDPAVAEYHNRIARMLSAPDAKATSLKDYAAYKAEVQKIVNERAEALRKIALPDKKIALDDVRLGRLQDAYVILRVIHAIDAGAAKQETQNTFVPAAQGIVNDVVPPQLDNGRRLQKSLADQLANGVTQAGQGDWNRGVVGLRLRVREIKRLCRMHDYLVRMNLAKAGGADRFFGEAHQLLFVPTDAGKVWQEVGRVILVNNIAQLDIRVKVPYQETTITPMGVPFANKLAPPPNSWKAFDVTPTPVGGHLHGMPPIKK